MMEFKRMKKSFFVYAYRGYNRDKKRSVVAKMGEIDFKYNPSPDLFDQMKPSEIDEAQDFMINGRAKIAAIDEFVALSSLPALIDKAIKCADRSPPEIKSLPWMSDDVLVKIKEIAAIIRRIDEAGNDLKYHGDVRRSRLAESDAVI